MRIEFFHFKLSLLSPIMDLYTPVSVTRWGLKAHRGDFEMRNIHRGRVFSNCVKKTSNFLSPGKVKKSGGFVWVFANEHFWTVKFCVGFQNSFLPAFCLGLRFPLFLTKFFHRVIDRGTDTGVYTLPTRRTNAGK